MLHNRYMRRCERMTDAELQAAARDRTNKRFADFVRYGYEQRRIVKLSDDDLWREATSAKASPFHASVWNSRERNKAERAGRKAKKAADQQRQQQIDAVRAQFRAMSIDDLMAWQPPEHATGIELSAVAEELSDRVQSAGEGAVCILLGRDRRQAAILRRYCSGLLQAPLLAREVVRQTNEVIEFRNGASLEIASNDAASRGFWCLAGTFIAN